MTNIIYFVVFQLQMNQLCKVCGEPAAGFHFGAFTCEGCKVCLKFNNTFSLQTSAPYVRTNRTGNSPSCALHAAPSAERETITTGVHNAMRRTCTIHFVSPFRLPPVHIVISDLHTDCISYRQALPSLLRRTGLVLVSTIAIPKIRGKIACSFSVLEPFKGPY